MLRNYKRIPEKANWRDVDIKNAILYVEKGISIRKVAKTCNIPFATLQERIKMNKNSLLPRLGDIPKLLLFERFCLNAKINKVINKFP